MNPWYTYLPYLTPVGCVLGVLIGGNIADDTGSVVGALIGGVTFLVLTMTAAVLFYRRDYH